VLEERLTIASEWGEAVGSHVSGLLQQLLVESLEESLSADRTPDTPPPG
jgi:hypothetical protein